MKLLRLLASLLLVASAYATTTVTGTMNTLGAAGVTGGFVRFWLRGCGGNQPRINGTAVIAPTLGGVFYFDLVANSSGVISGTLYSNRDASGTGNGEIECGGSFTATWYGMQVFLGGKGGPEVPIYAKNSSTFDISNVTPISTTPVATAPTGDSTYARLDGGNQNFTGDIAAPAVNAIAYADVQAGADCGARINNALTLSSGLNGGNGEVQVSRACMALGMSTAVTPGVGQGIRFTSGGAMAASCNTCFTLHDYGNYIIGPGFRLLITHTGTGDFIRWQISTFGTFQAGRLSGFVIIGSGSGTSGIHMGDVVGGYLDDIEVRGYTAGYGVWFDNNTGWTERTLATRVWADNNLKGFRFTNTAGTQAQASFGYSRLLDIRCNTNAGQTCMSLEGGRLYHSQVSLIANMGGASPTLIALSGLQYSGGAGTAIDTSMIFVTAEGGTTPTNINLASGTTLSTCGFIDFPGSTSTLTGTLSSFLCYQATGGFSALWTNQSQILAGQPAGIETSVIPPFVAAGGGFAINAQWQGANYQFDTDATNNGGTLLLGDNIGTMSAYSVGTSVPANPQNITLANLNANNKVWHFGTLDFVFDKGVLNDGGGMKHKRFASPLGGSCPTGASIGAACTSANLNWTTAFADNNYSVSCSLDSVTAQPHIVNVTKQAAGAGVTVTIAADTAAAANAGVECIATHD